MDIIFNGVSKRYEPNIIALENIFLQINRGEFVYLIGETGSGKSTLLRCITREVLPTRGHINVGRTSLRKMSRVSLALYRREIGVVFQDFLLLPKLSVAENVAFVLETMGYSEQNIIPRVSEVLKQVGLWPRRNMYPSQLSGGEQQRLAIARAIVNNPSLLIADEPTGNLDDHTAEQIMKLIFEINRSGTTVLMATHNSTLVNTHRHRVIEMSQGRIIRDEKNACYDALNEEAPKRQEQNTAPAEQAQMPQRVMQGRTITEGAVNNG